ncbi:MAG: UbiD family decarboxylase [Candidatus Tectomicrobia bacterium]|nr:UbiD family decarboxylase [Candidatus Tectomicrobia bacterium]
MAKDLRSYLKQLQEKAPEELRRVSREVSHKWEPIALIAKMDREGLYPAVLFERVKGFEFPVLANLLSSRKKFAVALDTTEDRVAEVLAQREVRPIPPRPVETGPVKDVRYIGDEADLGRLPIILHHERNDAPYITMGVLVAKDPETGASNLGIYRHKLIGRNRLGVYYSWGKRLQYIHRKAEVRDEPLECAIVVGMHPAFHMASQALVSRKEGADEYEVAGGLLDEPVEVVRCETVDVEVPARAEIVIEGRILPRVRQREGPFAEYHRYYGQIVDAPEMEVTAITHRKDAIYHNLGEHMDQISLNSFPREAQLLRELRGVLPTVQAVCVPFSGVMYHAYIQMEKVNEGDAKNILMAALTRTPYIKTAFAFDLDVDIFDEGEVLWALSTRVIPDRDIFMVPGARGNRLDPTTYILTRLQRDGMVTKMGVDATAPIGYDQKFPKRAEIPGVNRLGVGVFIGPAAN